MENNVKKINKNNKNAYIHVHGAREHNLKNITVSIPKDTLTIITGPSGSGKSSLALDILYTEGKRRYMESLSSYARQFLGIPKRPDFDRIDGLCPAVAIEQKTVGNNPRSTVGTITEIYDYLRVLFARVGVVHCPTCRTPISAQSPEAIAAIVLHAFTNKTITIASPIAIARKGEFNKELLSFFQRGFYRFIIDGQSYKFKSEDDIKALKLKKTYTHTIDLLIDSLEVLSEEQSRIVEAIETAFKYAEGFCKVIVGDTEHMYSRHTMCVRCVQAVPELEPRLFSFNSPIGACQKCEGIGVIQHHPWAFYVASRSEEGSDGEQYGMLERCPECEGKRLNPFALAVLIDGRDIIDLTGMSIKHLMHFFEHIVLDQQRREIAHTMIQEIINRLRFLHNVGLGYLTLARTARSLSGGEGQRIRLATQIGSALSGVLYILDEPSIGLHQRDNDRLIQTLKALRDLGNTVVVVEHDTDTMQAADYIIDMGPGAGVRGGQITAVGSPSEVSRNKQSLTGDFLSGRRAIVLPQKRRASSRMITLHDISKNNIHNVTISFPLDIICGISGVSGSGKSTLVMQELVPLIKERMMHANKAIKNEKWDKISGFEYLANMVVIDQSPIGRTPRSNPATYLGIFDTIRALYASLPESKARGYKVGRFSFNTMEGRCFECQGEGSITVEMHFLPPVIVTCKSCKGLRYNKETLQITYKSKTIADVLAMTAYEALQLFGAHETIAKRLRLLCDVGLDYLTLGQPSTTLSGGEAQRIKLVDELAKRGKGTLYVLDEPTTGLHSADIERLLTVFNTLVDKGNSMIIIEHNLDVLKTVDYIIDMGPEGGDEGGCIVAQGTPEEVVKNEASYTGRYLKPLLQ